MVMERHLQTPETLQEIDTVRYEANITITRKEMKKAVKYHLHIAWKPLFNSDL